MGRKKRSPSSGHPSVASVRLSAAARQIMSYFPSLSLSFFVRECRRHCRRRMTRRNAAVAEEEEAGGETSTVIRRRRCCRRRCRIRSSLGSCCRTDERTPIPFLGRCPCGAIDRISRLRPTLAASPLASRQAQDFVFLCLVG